MHTARQALYRCRQFFGALRPRVDARLRDDASALLGDGERRLFASMTPRDQQHCLEVFDHLRRNGHHDDDLLVAALLHDAGKGRIAVWHRVAFVVLSAGAPSLLPRLATPGDGAGWRQALYRCLHHEELGAQRARDAGSRARVVALIGGEDFETLDERALALRAADDAV